MVTPSRRQIERFAPSRSYHLAPLPAHRHYKRRAAERGSQACPWHFPRGLQICRRWGTVMKSISGWLWVWALIVFCGSMSSSDPAAAKGVTLGVDVADTSGTLTSETVVQLLDTTGKGGICDLVKLVPGSD